MLLDDDRGRRLIDTGRALGILLVILFHTLLGTTKLLPADGTDALVASLPESFNFAWQALGSEVIFLISGFLIAYILLREYARTGAIDVRRFIAKRVSRIVPLYLLALALHVPFVNFKWWELPLNLLFVSKLFKAETIIPVGWSLEALVQMYIAMPFLVMLVVRARHPRTIIGGLIVASVVVRAWALARTPAAYTTPFAGFLYGASPNSVQQDLYYLLWFRATPFLLGLLAAYQAVYHAQALRAFFTSRRNVITTSLIAGALLVSSSDLPIHDRGSFLYDRPPGTFWLWFWTLQRPVFGLASGLLLLVLLCTRDGWAGAFGDALAWRGFGVVSRSIYPIYLFHIVGLILAAVLVFRTVDPDAIVAVQPWQVVTIFALAALFAIRLGAVITRRIELPAQAWLRAKFLPLDTAVLVPHGRPEPVEQQPSRAALSNSEAGKAESNVAAT